MLRFLFITLLTVLLCESLHGATGPKEAGVPEPGVGRDLARSRAAHYRDVRYGLRVRIAPGADVMTGAVEIRVTLDPGAGDLVLDWRPAAKDGKPLARVWDIEVNGRRAGKDDARLVNEHVVIRRALLRAGENVVRLSFESPISATGSAAVTRYRDREDGAEYVYTLFVPSDASTAFPCFDQPDLKARFKLDITVPEAWKVVTNTTPETGGDDQASGMKRIRFRETEPISTYVFAFAAGEFAEFRDDASPLGTRLFVRKSKAERARKELAEVFRLNRDGVEFFARYFDHPFPFTKYDLVVIPEFPFRGMEHAGATFLREESILFPTDPTANDLW
ncbi:MAG: M1 family aminopeptidase, partial [Pyrinomonadaceae bacterium]